MTAAANRAARPQLALEELQQFRWLLGGVLILLALVTACYIDVGVWVMLAVGGTATLAAVLRPRLPARVPRFVHLLAFPVVAAFFVGDLWLHGELLPAMVRLDMALLTYRAIIYRQRRDDLQVIVLGLFLVVVAGVLTVSLVFAVHLLAYTVCALGFLLVITLAEAAKSAVPVAPEPPSTIGSMPSWAERVNWAQLLARVRATTDWRVVAVGTGLFAGVIGVTALLFLVMPRFQLDNGMFLDRFITKKARTGFSESIKFGDVTEIQQDTSVALSVDVSDPAQVPASPYWRMLVLDEYANGSFRLSAALRHDAFARERTGNSIGGSARARQNPAVWTFFLEPGVSRFLPLLGDFGQLRFNEAQTFQPARAVALVALRNEPVAMTAYRVERFDTSGWVRGTVTEAGDGLPFDTRRGAAGVSESDRAMLVALAQEIAGPDRADAGRFAAAACAWLRDRHNYTLSPRIPAGANDPLVRWMTSREAGHCELFAGSFVLLARAAGYPARVVTGFRGGSWNAFSNSFTVRNSDAHAWAEIYDATVGGWRRADPLELPAPTQEAAGAAAATALARRTDRSWTARLESLRVFWYRRIVSFDERAQAETLRNLKEASRTAASRLRDRAVAALASIKAWVSAPWDAGRIGRVVTLSGLAAAAAGLWRLLRRWRWRAGFWRGDVRREDPLRREAGRWLTRLASANGADHEHATVIADLQRLRFGPRATWPEPAGVFQRARRACRAARRPRRTLSGS